MNAAATSGVISTPIASSRSRSELARTTVSARSQHSLSAVCVRTRVASCSRDSFDVLTPPPQCSCSPRERVVTRGELRPSGEHRRDAPRPHRLVFVGGLLALPPPPSTRAAPPGGPKGLPPTGLPGEGPPADPPSL